MQRNIALPSRTDCLQLLQERGTQLARPPQDDSVQPDVGTSVFVRLLFVFLFATLADWQRAFDSAHGSGQPSEKQMKFEDDY